MVAHAHPTVIDVPRFGALAPIAFDPRRRVLRLTVDDVEAMVRAGVVQGDALTELLDGQLVLVDRSGRGEEPGVNSEGHDLCTELWSGLRGKIDGPTRHVRSQTTLVLTPTHAPLPDFMIVRGGVRHYAPNRSRPTSADAFCVVEIADSSYGRDTGEKLEAYARAGVPQYIVLNLAARNAEVYATPDRDAGTYAPPTIVPADGTLALRIGDGGETFEVPLADVLP